MARSIVKAMLAVKVNTYARGAKTYADLREDSWESSDGVKRFRVGGFVTTPSGLTVIVWSGGPIDDPMKGSTSCSIYHNGKAHHASVLWATSSKITLRRVAVAFAKKAKGGR